MVGGCEYDRFFMRAETDGVTGPTASHRCNVSSVLFRYYGNTPGRRRPRVHPASMPPAIALASVQPTYGDGRVGTALSHIAKRRNLRCPDQGRLGDRSVSAIQHYTSEAASPLSTQPGRPPTPYGTAKSGRVEVWRGRCRSNISVAAPFVWRCLTGSAVAPSPHPAHRTGHADLPHPALGQDLTPSPTTRRAQADSGVRARSARRGARVDRSRPCVA